MNKAVVVLSAVLVQLCLGGECGWSAFVQPLRHEHGFSAAATLRLQPRVTAAKTEAWLSTQTSLTLGLDQRVALTSDD